VSQIEYVVEFTIHPRSLDEFKTTARKVIRRVRAEEPGTVVYQWYLSIDGRKCYVVERFPDSAALVAHARSAVLADLLPTLLQFSTLDEVRVFGRPTAEAARVLAVLATTTTVTISRSFAGFVREPGRD
jgi:quinol monooxygenase YgiN